MTATPTTEPIATPAIAPFDSPPPPVEAGVDNAVVLVVGTEVDAGGKAGLGDVVGVDEAVDDEMVVV